MPSLRISPLGALCRVTVFSVLHRYVATHFRYVFFERFISFCWTIHVTWIHTRREIENRVCRGMK